MAACHINDWADPLLRQAPRRRLDEFGIGEAVIDFGFRIGFENVLDLGKAVLQRLP